VRAAQRQIGRYLVALGCINAVVGACTAAAMWMLGAPNPVLWGVVAFVLQFVPYIGPLIVMGLLLVVGATTFVAVPDMLAPALTFLLIHAVESNLVSPWIVGRRLSLSPVSVFLSVMFWGWLWGIPGALIAVPVLIALRNLAQRSRRLKLLRRFLEGDRDLAPSMRSLLRLPVRTRGVTPRPVVNIPAAMSPASTPVEVDGTREASGALPSWGYRFESPPA
jgi:predicted PurR-regulated permease PerM